MDDTLRSYEIIVDTLEMLVILIGLVGGVFAAFRIAHRVGIFHGEAMTEMKHIASATEETKDAVLRHIDDNSAAHEIIRVELNHHGERLASVETEVKTLHAHGHDE